MKRILITGAAGFIGANMLSQFMNEGTHKVVGVVDALTYAGINRSVIENHPAIQTYWFDINRLNWDYVLSITSPDVIINLAAESHVDNSLVQDMHEVFLHSNVMGVFKILNAIREYKCTTGKQILFLHMSTDEVLGDLSLTSTQTLDETAPLCPNNPYSATKAMAELGIQSMWHSYRDFDCVIMRATNNYGPLQHPEKFIPTLLRSIATDQRVPVYGTGENIREWLHVHDFSAGVSKLITTVFNNRDVIFNDNTVPIVHFGSGERLSNNKVVELAKNCFPDKRVKETFVTDRKGHDRRYALNSTLARKVLEWYPQHKLIDFFTTVADTTKNTEEKE